jgi:hypothetical protein
VSTYSEKLRDPRWQRKRLEILSRDEFACRKCHDNETTLNVHHTFYQSGLNPWEYPDESLFTLCEDCHEYETQNRQKADTRLIWALQQSPYWADDIEELIDCLLAAGPLLLLSFSAWCWAMTDKQTLETLESLHGIELRKRYGNRETVTS